MSILKFPHNLSDKTDSYIYFFGYDEKGPVDNTAICLYMPNNINIADGASFNSLDMGVITAEAIAGVLGGSGPKEKAEKLGAALEKATPASNDKAMNAAILSKIMGNFSLGSSTIDKARDVYLQQKGIAINPNTNLQYTNSELRSFAFQFKMVASSPGEARDIKKITHSLRRGMYAKKDGVTLQYPYKWKVMFFSFGQINDHLPKLYDLYLTALNVTYNATGNMMHYDGAPAEVDIQVTFRETKALSRDDIEDLEGDENSALRRKRINDAKIAASVGGLI